MAWDLLLGISTERGQNRTIIPSGGSYIVRFGFPPYVTEDAPFTSVATGIIAINWATGCDFSEFGVPGPLMTTGGILVELLFDGAPSDSAFIAGGNGSFAHGENPNTDPLTNLLVVPYSILGTITAHIVCTNMTPVIVAGPLDGGIFAWTPNSGQAVVPYPPWPPSITLTTKAHVTAGALYDVATLANGSSPTGTITFRLYGPSPDPLIPDCSGAPIFTSVVPVHGNGAYPSQSYSPGVPGLYTFTAEYSGDAHNPARLTACSDATESVALGDVPGISRFRRSDSAQLWFVPT